MNETSLSLLNRLQSSPESQSWDRLVKLYGPLIEAWARKYDVQASDADDLTQEVLLAVAKDIGKFEHGGQVGAFRGWLKAILINRLRNFWRARNRHAAVQGDSGIDSRLAEWEDPASQMSQIWNREHDQHVLWQLLELVKPKFSETTWEAFQRVAMRGQKADEVAYEMGISLNAVFIAKSRVLSCLRQEADGLVESSSSFLGNR